MVRLFARCMYLLVLLRVAVSGLRSGVRPGVTGDASTDKAEEGRERRHIGRRGELLAYWYLRRAGYRIIRNNFRTAAGGEVDLIAWDGPVLVFVEVKTRTTPTGNEPEAAVHLAKQASLRKAARAYLKRRNWPDTKYRFDVVALAGGKGWLPIVRLHKAAFGA